MKKHVCSLLLCAGLLVGVEAQAQNAERLP